MRRKKFHQQIVNNIRSAHPWAVKYTDDQLYNAHEDFSLSDDFNDESKLELWVEQDHEGEKL